MRNLKIVSGVEFHTNQNKNSTKYLTKLFKKFNVSLQQSKNSHKLMVFFKLDTSAIRSIEYRELSAHPYT